jgi:hypothetical protein
MKALTIAIIPDCQVRPGITTTYLSWIGEYLAAKQPPVIVCLGDFADMPSLNSHANTRELEQKRYSKDIASVHSAMARLMKPIQAVKGWKPKLILTLGNHEQRLIRATADNPRLYGTISMKDLRYEEFGWRVFPYLQPVSVGGVEFAHLFTSGAMGRPVSSAAALLRTRQGSAVQGHRQDFDLAVHPKTGRFGMFAGTCNMHDEPYLSPQGQPMKRQIVMLHEVRQGIADFMTVSLRFLRDKYS